MENVNMIASRESIASEHRRRLPLVPVTGNASRYTLDIPKDTVIKRMEIRLFGSFDVTYTSGSPIASPLGNLERLIGGGISVVANGSRYIKSVSPFILGRIQALLTAQTSERSYSTSASAPTSLIGQTEMSYGASFVYPATTNFVVINESITISFEMPFCDGGVGREATLFNTKGLSSCVLQFEFGDISNLQQDASSPVSITYGNRNLNIAVTLVESPDIDASAKFLDYRESFRRVQFSSENKASAVDLPRGNWLAYIAFLVRNGDANKTPSDAALREIELRVNGSRVVQSTTFLELQQGMRMSRGIIAPKGTASAGVTHNLQGFAVMNLLKNSDIRTALNTSSKAGVDQLQMLLTTAPASGVDAATYTNPVEVTMQFGEIVQVQ